MRRFIAGLVTGVALTAAVGALAVTTRTVLLRFRDTANVAGGDVSCTVHGGGVIICRTGGDYRGKYGVLLNPYWAELLRFKSSKTDDFVIVTSRHESPLK